MRALQLTNIPEEKARLDVKCKELLTKAERIKGTRSWRPIAHQLIKLNEPQSSRNLSNREQIILLESAKVNGFIFPPWTCPPEKADFDLKEGEPEFTSVSPRLPRMPVHLSFYIWQF
jgi:calpain-7